MSSIDWYAAIAVGAVAIAALRYPFTGLLAYLWFDFMRPQDMYADLRALRPMMVIGIATVAGAVWRERHHLGARWQALLPVGTVAAIAGATVPLSIAPAQSAAAFLDVVKLVVLIWLIDRLVTDERRARAVVWVVAASLGVLAFAALARRGLSDVPLGLTVGGPAGLGDGTFRDNNDLARVLALAAPLWWLLAVSARRPLTRWLATAGAAISLGGTLATFSRSGVLAVLAGAAVVAASYRPLWHGAALWVCLALLLTVLSPSPLRERFASFEAPRTDTSVEGRLAMWRDASTTMRRRPLVGQGVGTFRVDTDGTPNARRPSHNIVVELAVELGIAGVMAFAWTMLDALRRLWRVRQQARDAWPTLAAVGCAGGLLGYLTAAMTLSHPFASPPFVLVGLALALEHAAPPTRPQTAARSSS